jgi:hypothetical protein
MKVLRKIGMGLAVVLYLAVWLISTSTHAEESWFTYEAAVGADYQPPPGNGLWYQQQYAHSFKLASPTAEFGVTGSILPWLDWHADYVWLGTTGSNALATSADGCMSGCGPLATFSGHGNTQGIFFSLEPHTNWGNYRVGFEAGPLVFFPNWEETVYNWTHTPASTPTTIQVHNHRGPRLGFMAGLNVGRGHWRIGYQFFYTRVTTNQDPTPPLTGMVHMIFLKYVW